MSTTREIPDRLNTNTLIPARAMKAIFAQNMLLP
jgi:hypothetical protein